MTLMLWTQLILAFSVLFTVCAFARRKAPVTVAPASVAVRPASATVLRLAA